MGRKRCFIWRRIWPDYALKYEGTRFPAPGAFIIDFRPQQEFFKTSATTIGNQGVPLPVVEAWRERATEELDERRQNVWYYTSAMALETSVAKL
jgi:hypothetical protein